jgi:hypothetical protein
LVTGQARKVTVTGNDVRAEAYAPRRPAHATRAGISWEGIMATACLFLGFDAPRPGREKEAFPHLTGAALTKLEAFKKDGWFESFDMCGLTPHGGDLNLLILIKGERAKLDELRRTDAFERFSMELMQLFSGYGVVPGVTLEGMRKVIERNPELGK